MKRNNSKIPRHPSWVNTGIVASIAPTQQGQASSKPATEVKRMYKTAVVSEDLAIVSRSSSSYADLEDAKEAARQLPLEEGQRPAVIDDTDVIVWTGLPKSIKNGFR